MPSKDTYAKSDKALHTPVIGTPEPCARIWSGLPRIAISLIGKA